MSIRNDILLKIRAALGGAPLGAFNMSNRNKILADTVQAAGGTVRNASNLNMLLEDLYNALSADSGTITITGSGFGVGPEVVLWNTVDNQDWGGVLDGEPVPTRSEVATSPYHGAGGAGKIMQLESAGSFGNRTRVMHSIGSAFMGLPDGADTALSGITKLYQQFKMKADFLPFSSASTKFFRVWDDLAGVWLRISVSTSALYVGQSDGTPAVIGDAQDVTTGYMPENRWVVVESTVDVIANEARCSYFNIPTGIVNDPVVALHNPSATGVIASLMGFDSGSSGIADDKDIWYTDHYVSKGEMADSRVEIHSSAVWGESLYREIQIAESWTDGQVTFNLDAQEIDPNNYYASVIVDEVAVQTIMVGNPSDITQDIRRPISNINNSALASLGTEWSGITNVNVFETKFLLIQGAFDEFKFSTGTGYSEITYDRVNQQWNLKTYYGTLLSIPASKLWDDNLEHTLRVELNGTSASLYIDGTLEGTIVASFNALWCKYIGTSVNKVGAIAGYMWETKLLEPSNPSNDVYLKLDEQVGTDGVGHILNYAQNVNGVEYNNINIKSWDYRPNEGY